MISACRRNDPVDVKSIIFILDPSASKMPTKSVCFYMILIFFKFSFFSAQNRSYEGCEFGHYDSLRNHSHAPFGSYPCHRHFSHSTKPSKEASHKPVSSFCTQRLQSQETGQYWRWNWYFKTKFPPADIEIIATNLWASLVATFQRSSFASTAQELCFNWSKAFVKSIQQLSRLFSPLQYSYVAERGKN